MSPERVDEVVMVDWEATGREATQVLEVGRAATEAAV